MTDPDSRLPSDQLIESTYSSYGTLRKAVRESAISAASTPADSCALTGAYGIGRPFWSHHKSGRKTSVAASDKLRADSFTARQKWMRRTPGSMSGWRGKKPKFLDVHWLKFTSGKIPRTRCPIGILRMTPGYSVWLWCFRKEESQSKTKVTLFPQLYLGERLRISLGLSKYTNGSKINCSTSSFSFLRRECLDGIFLEQPFNKITCQTYQITTIESANVMNRRGRSDTKATRSPNLLQKCLSEIQTSSKNALAHGPCFLFEQEMNTGEW